MSLEGRIAEIELLRLSLEVSHIGLCLIAVSGNIVMLAGGFAASLDTTDERLLGNHFRNLLVPGLVLNAESKLFSMNAPEVAQEGWVRRADGTTAIIVLQARTVTRNAEQFRILTLLDMSNFGVTRNAFLDMRRTIDALNSAVVIADARRPDCPIVSVNKRFEQLTGFSAEFAIGRNCRFLQGTDRDQDGRHKLAEAVRLRQGCHVRLRNYRRDGSMFVSELFISPVFDVSTALTHYVGLQRECKDRTIPYAEYEQQSN